MIDDELKKKISNFKFSDEALEIVKAHFEKPIQPQSYGNTMSFAEVNKEIQDRAREKIDNERRLVISNERIADNTDFLARTVNMIQINADRQVELLEIISSVLALANEENKQVAENKLKNIVNSMQGFKDNFELCQFVYELGKTVINI